MQEQPAENWGVDDLGRFARACHQEIEFDEASLTQSYWRLGLALNLARSHFARGQWSGFLDEWGIDKTRASKARAIQRSFKTRESVEGMSVQEAYKQRKRKIGRSSAKNSRRSRRETGPDLADWLFDVCEKTSFYFEEIQSAAKEEAVEWLPAVEHAIKELGRLRSRLRERASRA